MAFVQRKTARIAAVVSVLTAALGSAGVAQTPVPGLGTWKLNVAKSKNSPGAVAKSGTVTFATVGQGVKAVIDVVGPDGGPIRERGPIKRGALLRAENGRRVAAGLECEVAHARDRFLFECGEPASERIEKMNFGSFDGGPIEVRKAYGLDIVGKAAGEWRIACCVRRTLGLLGCAGLGKARNGGEGSETRKTGQKKTSIETKRHRKSPAARGRIIPLGHLGGFIPFASITFRASGEFRKASNFFAVSGFLAPLT